MLRNSASLIVMRPCSAVAGRGFEVLLLLRNARTRTSFPSVWVFPGGVEEPSDDGTLQTTALRETFEECGLTVGFATPPESGASEVAQWRRDVYADPAEHWSSFVQWCGTRGEALLSPFTTWITPTFEKKRFETAFFLGQCAVDAEVDVDGSEIIEHLWLQPADALARHRDGDLALMPPQVWILTALSHCGDSESEARRLGRALQQTLPPVLPELLERSDDGRVTLVLPWDVEHSVHRGETVESRHRVSFKLPLGTSPVELTMAPRATRECVGFSSVDKARL